MKNKRVLITGGAGFIGSNLTRALCRENKVVIMDDFSSGRKDNIKNLPQNLPVEIVSGSITDLELLKKTLEGTDYVFHLAARPSVSESVEDPLGSSEVNLGGTLNVLHTARVMGLKKVIFASSAAVYGNLTEIPLKEHLPTYPESPYGIQKLGGEHYARVFYEVYGLATTSLRFFNVFGPHQNPDSQYASVIPRFITRIQDNLPPVIFGKGDQTRDFIYVEDVVSACIMAAERSSSDGKVLNIACGKETSIRDLALTLMEQVGVDMELVFKESRVGDIARSCADISLSEHLLDFEPKYSLESGLEKTIEHFEKTT